MNHIWVVESSGGKKWRASGESMVNAFFSKKSAAALVRYLAKGSPGLKWRVAKYERVK